MKRAELLERLDDPGPWDILVIGGGATGLGAAVDAAARGYRTLLLERADFASGTSSRSTKLIHGGVRYLRQGSLALVREALREREILLRNAPHLVHALPFVVPVCRWWEGPYYAAGLKCYDLIAGRSALGPSRRLSRDEVLQRLPGLEPAGLRGGILYYDAQFDDARLALDLARTVIDLGGVAINYVEVTGFTKTCGKICGVMARDTESGREYAVTARAVVNATGIFGDAVRRLDDGAASPMLAPSQGAHLVLDSTFLPGCTAMLIPHTPDGRVLFAIPWLGRVLIGTTETPVARIVAEPRPLAEEVDYLLTQAGRWLHRHPTRTDVLSTFAGLRPLVRPSRGTDSAVISREHSVFVSASGLISVAGGKWTTYRKMAVDIIDRAAAIGGLEAKVPESQRLKIHGWRDHSSGAPCGVSGGRGETLESLGAACASGDNKLHFRLPYREMQVVRAVRDEFARTVEDVLARRTRALFLDARASMEIAPRVVQIMASELGQDIDWQRSQVAGFSDLARQYLPA